MNLVQEMYTTIAQEVFGTTKFTTRGHTFDLADEWKIVDYKDEIKRQTGVDIITASDKEITAKLDELGVKYDGTNRERLTDTLWKYCRKGIAGPAFLINHPKLVAPLAKANPNDPTTVQRFQPILAGSEVGNGYSELNDPIDQRQRFELQQKLIESGDEEAMMPEWEFVDMLEHGMPPTCGFGFGERLFAFFVDKPVRETQLFPLMKPEDAEGSAGKKSKDKDTKVAVAVINKGSKLEAWQELNTIGHLSAAFGARTGKNLFSQPHITTKDGQHINLNIQHAIVIKEAHATADLKTLVAHAKKAGLIIEEFTREMIETTNDKKVAAKTKEKNHEEIEYLGVLVFGPKSSVDEFTSSFALYSGK
jgi:lysyl-tRNA synthetase class 2